MRKMKKLNLKRVTILNFNIQNNLKGGVQSIQIDCYTDKSCRSDCNISCNPQSTGPTEPQSIDSIDGISGTPNCAL